MIVVWVVLAAILTLAGIFGGAALVIRLSEAYRRVRADASEESALAEDPPWENIRKRSDLSDDEDTVRELHALYGANGSVEFSPDCPLLIDSSGAIRFTIEAFCTFAIRLAPRIPWTLQVVQYPRDYEDRNFLDYATAILCNGGWLGYVIAEPRAQVAFNDWKRIRMVQELRREFMKRLGTRDHHDAQLIESVRVALERLFSLPAYSPSN